MYKLFIYLLFTSLLLGCTQQETAEENKEILVKYNQIKSEYERLNTAYYDLKDEYEILEKKYHDLKENDEEIPDVFNNSQDDSIYLIDESNYFSLFSKREYSEKIKHEEYINKPVFIYNGIQKLALKLDSTDALNVNEQLKENENKALDMYKLNDEYYLKEACFLSYDIEETEDIISITSNLYTHVLDAGRPGILYDTYNFDIKTGTRLNNEYFFQYLNINIDTLCEILNQYFNQRDNTHKPFKTDDLLTDKTDNSRFGITFSLIEDSLIITCSANVPEQYILDNYGKIAIPLSKIINQK